MHLLRQLGNSNQIISRFDRLVLVNYERAFPSHRQHSYIAGLCLQISKKGRRTSLEGDDRPDRPNRPPGLCHQPLIFDTHLPLSDRKINGNATDQAVLRFAESVSPIIRYEKAMENRPLACFQQQKQIHDQRRKSGLGSRCEDPSF